MQYNPESENVQRQQNPGMFQGTEAQRVSTNTPDPQYDLVSVLYHALEGAQVCERYAQDAGREGDRELSLFFQQAQRNQISCAEKAKQLLGQRLSQGSFH